MVGISFTFSSPCLHGISHMVQPCGPLARHNFTVLDVQGRGPVARVGGHGDFSIRRPTWWVGAGFSCVDMEETPHYPTASGSRHGLYIRDVPELPANFRTGLATAFTRPGTRKGPWWDCPLRRRVFAVSGARIWVHGTSVGPHGSVLIWRGDGPRLPGLDADRAPRREHSEDRLSTLHASSDAGH